MDSRIINKYPRICAHRGLSALCPEDTMPAFGAAIALGVEEIELDIWGSKDGKLIICHDVYIDRTSNGSGKICDMEYSEIKELDFGSWFSPKWKGLKAAHFEKVMKYFHDNIIINIHIKDPGEDGWVVKKTCDIIKKYNAVNTTYIAGDADVLTHALSYAPEIERCCLERQAYDDIIDRAIKFKCKRLQFLHNAVTKEMVMEAHKNDIICNVFYTDDVEEAGELLDMGIDTILTNNAILIGTVFDERGEY